VCPHWSLLAWRQWIAPPLVHRDEEDELRRSEEIALQAKMSVWWRKQITRAAAAHHQGGTSPSSSWDGVLAWLETNSIKQQESSPSPSSAVGAMGQAQEVYVWRLIKRMRRVRPHSRPYRATITVWPLCGSESAGATVQWPHWVKEIVAVLASHRHHHHGSRDDDDNDGKGSSCLRARVQAARQEVARRLMTDSTLRRGHRQARMAAAIHIQVVPPLLTQLIDSPCPSTHTCDASV
jgi:hypothetical protein